MKEAFLHYLWQTRRFDQQELKTTNGLPIEILSWGHYNTYGGPDFHQAKIRIGAITWAGQVEHHVKASDWYAHQHQNDEAYDQVILHVVYEEDQIITRSNGEQIPCLELKGRISPGLYKRYQRLVHQAGWIPCERHISSVPDILRKLWLDRILVERLENKTEKVKNLFEQNRHNWETTFYHWLAYGFGLKINSEPFLQLARSLPLTTIQRHRDSLFQIEALLFGQAGMLEKVFNDSYPNRLKKEYGFLREKYDLQPIAYSSWNFGGIRPANFPSIRLAQFALLLHQSAHLFSKVLVAKNVKELEHAFELKISHYWLTHYTLDKEAPYIHKSLGKSAIHLLVINIIAPVLFFYGQYKKEEKYKMKALALLEELPPEKNSVLARWKSLGIPLENAHRTQALLELKKQYCDRHDCLRCSIGHNLLKSG